ncbi:hypothetical protein [Chitinivibrio alkaliphilus]|uniref:Uncharacterized protein n=1 Tax=Chitinivibrio alkaliphilus ACht1 TaxID=1313304 RepID=U7D5H8_9BACT|nr:hypothetical protein [Chitinivibrio alkaliphilus]ERP31779.1 hypothetical protein CALK_1222 [Chitinivibrio alkaliphilus ACht1]
MKMNWNFQGTHLVEDALSFYSRRLEEAPEELLRDLDDELEALYIRFDNDQLGRGIVGDADQTNRIAALQAVRAECLKRLKNRPQK